MEEECLLWRTLPSHLIDRCEIIHVHHRILYAYVLNKKCDKIIVQYISS